MKSKAKPVKGSARTKRFDVGGTVGALAGLGTLAYLMSRKKKGADGEYKPQGKFPQEQSQETAKREEYVAADADENKAKKDALSGGMKYKKPEGPAAVEEKTTKPGIYGPYIPKFVRDKTKPAPPPAAKPKTGQGSSTTTGVDAGIAAGNKKAEDENSPQAKAVRAQRDERTRQKFLQSRAGLSRTGITTAGDPNKKEATLEPSARTKNVIKAVQGTIDNATKSTVRSDTDKMRERALEVERRRKEEKAAKQGYGIKNGGAVKKYAAGGSVKASGMGSVKTAKPSMGSASKRADGIAQRGKTRGKVC